jgi:hypothetical protein
MYVMTVGYPVLRELSLIRKGSMFQKPMMLHSATTEMYTSSGTSGVESLHVLDVVWVETFLL